MKLIVNIDGNIGSGKTTIINKLFNEEELKDIKIFIIEEKQTKTEEGNKILVLFYSNMKLYSFDLNKYILDKFEESIEDIFEKEKDFENCLILIDRSLCNLFFNIQGSNFHIFIKKAYEDKNINDNDFLILENKYYKIKERLNDYITNLNYKVINLYININIDKCYLNIQNRSRKCESTISKEYLGNY